MDIDTGPGCLPTLPPAQLSSLVPPCQQLLSLASSVPPQQPLLRLLVSPVSPDSTIHSSSRTAKNPGQSQNPRRPPLPLSRSFKRDIYSQWYTDAHVASRTSLHKDTITLISNLGIASMNILNNNQDMPSLTSSSLAPTSGRVASDQSQEENSLGAIANRIRNLEKKGMDLDFEMAISLIKFELKLDILHREKKKDFATIVREEIQPGRELDGCSVHQGKRWRAWGSRLVELAGAGKYFIFQYE